MKISVIIPCKNRIDHLRESLPRVFRQSYQDLEVIIVDYNCPQQSGEWAEKTFKCTVVYCDVESGEWSLSAARNQGFLHSTGEVILFLDADTLLDNEFIIQSFLQMKPGMFMTGLTQPPWNGCGCMMVYRKDFICSLGYNEALKAWGYEDIDMYTRLEKQGLKRVEFSPNLIINIPHSDEIRNEFHEGKDKYTTCELNFELSKTTFKSSL